MNADTQRRVPESVAALLTAAMSLQHNIITMQRCCFVRNSGDGADSAALITVHALPGNIKAAMLTYDGRVQGARDEACVLAV